MQPIVNWLVARPRNAVFGLAATLLLPFAQVISGAVMVLLALQLGAGRSLLMACVAGAVLAAVALVVGTPTLHLAVNAMVTWIPVWLLASLMQSTRSLTLALQVAAILAMVATVGIFAGLGDPTLFWAEVLTRLETVFGELGLHQQAQLLTEQKDVLASQMTMLVVSSSWSLCVLVLLLGYALYQLRPGQDGRFGRFRDLNFGRVLAVMMALTSVGAVATGAVWLQNLAFVAFAVFWIQGLAIVHWLHAEQRLHLVVVIGLYVLLPLLNALLMMALAVVGYTDAWFGFRKRRIAG